MKATLSARGWWVKHFAYLLIGTLLVICGLSLVLAKADEPLPEWQWAKPQATAFKRVGPVATVQSTSNLFNNIDCSPISYRLTASHEPQTGCFTPTALGWMDSDSDTVIFNGTDEGVPLLAHSNNQVLVAWPAAADLVALDTLSTGGSRVSLYKNPLNHTQDQRDLGLHLTAKLLTTAPDLPLLDGTGKPLVINTQTLAFSDGGSWLVAETLGGSFVRINLATLDEVPFAPAFGSQGSPALLRSQVAVSSDGRYVAVANDDAGSFKVYDLKTCSGSSASLQPENCQSYDYWPFVAQQVGGLRTIRHLRFVNQGLLSFEVAATAADKGGSYELSPAASIDSLIDYLAMGDSYTSGEGAFDYLAGTDSAANKCHLSVRSYPLLLTNDLFSSRGGHSVACSGAVIDDVGSKDDRYAGQVSGGVPYSRLESDEPLSLASVIANFSPGYVAQQRFVAQYQPGIITVSVGGNDIGFGDMLARCVEPHLTRHESDNTCFNTYEDRLEVVNLIDATVPKWSALFKQLAAESSVSRIYAIGYPDIVDDTGSCALNVHLDKSELEFTKEIVRYLNAAISQAAAAAGVNYVDITDALAGHRLCETASYNVAVNGLTAGGDEGIFGIGVIGHESYHPNALGHRLIEQAILDKTDNFKATALSGAPSGDSQTLLRAPTSGRPIAKRFAMPPQAALSGAVGHAAPITVKFAGLEYGLVPGAAYDLRLDGPSGPLLAAGIADSEAGLSVTANLDGTVTAGSHSLDVVGLNQVGETVDVSAPLFVAANPADVDDDGIPNDADSCPAAANSGSDADQDGIDDACDGLVGAASAAAAVSPAGLGQASAKANVQPANPLTKSGSIINARQPIRPHPTPPSRQTIEHPAAITNPKRLSRLGLPLTGCVCVAVAAGRLDKRFSNRAGNRLK